jgi:hypothetical protein
MWYVLGKRHANRNLAGKIERINRLGKPKHRWEDNIIIRLK